jgi:broad specificity phosphatase PhoE
VRVTLVRHGRAEAGWGDALDPGLDDVGRAQADAVAEQLSTRGPRALVSSPLLRCRETAAPLESRWGREARVEPAVGEIVWPGQDFSTRAAWLRRVMQGTYAEQDARLRDWRDAVVDALASLTEDTVVFTHYLAINAAVGAATGDDRVAHFSPNNCSCTELEVVDGRLRVVSLGDQATTRVQ